MAKTTDFGKEVKICLVNLDRSQEWLIDQVKERTGLYFDSSYLYKVLTGRNNSPKIVQAIREILGLPGQEQDDAASGQ